MKEDVIPTMLKYCFQSLNSLNELLLLYKQNISLATYKTVLLSCAMFS